MDISTNGVNFIKQFEGFSATAYKGAGEEYYTIGYGHYGADVQPDDTITEPEAAALLYSDLQYYVQQTNDIALSKFPEMNQNQFDACVSYCYNRGPGSSDGSNGLRQLIYNSSTLQEVSDNFLVYWGTNESAYEGLMNRRRVEQQLFNGLWGEPDIPDEPIIISKRKSNYKFVLFNKRRRTAWKKKNY